MSSYEVVQARALSKLNLVAPVQGLLCSLKEKQTDIPLTNSTKEYLVNFLKAFAGQDLEMLKDLEMQEEDEAHFFALFFGTLMLLIQRKAGSDVDRVQLTQSNDPQLVDVFIEFEFENLCRKSGLLAMKMLRVAQKLTENPEALNDFQQTTDDIISALKADFLQLCPGPAVQAFSKIADQRKIPWRRFSQIHQYVQFGHGKYQQIFQRSILGKESHTAAEVANSKEFTTTILGTAGLPVANQQTISTLSHAKQAAKQIGYPVVIKPIAGMQGYGITPNIWNEQELEIAYKRAQSYHRKFIIEKHIDGDDHRILVVEGRYVGCVRRSISVVIGDGVHTVDELVIELNKEPRRNQFKGDNKYHVRKLDVITECLKKQGLDWNSVPAKDQVVKLHIVPNLSQGGTIKEMSDQIHPENIKMAERAAAVLNLTIAGVDYLTTDITKPYWETGGGICEVNVSPAIDVMYPNSPPDLVRLFEQAFEISFPKDKNFALPVVILLDDGADLAEKIERGLTDQGLKVGVSRKKQATIENSPLMTKKQEADCVTAVLWNGVVDAAVIETTAIDVQRTGLLWDYATHFVIRKMPFIQGKSAPQLLDLICKTVDGSILIDGSIKGLSEWAETRQDLDIVKIEAMEGQGLEDYLVSDIVALAKG